MGSLTFDFLTDSFLFRDSWIQANFSMVSEQELVDELNRYREFCLSRQAEFDNEVLKNESILKMVSGVETPALTLLKQSAFYVEQYVINDPIFSFGYRNSEISQEMNSYMGLDKQPIDKADLARIISYVKSLTPMVAADYVKFLPIDHALEPPEQLPILHSENLFSNVLSEELFQFFAQRAVIKSLGRIPGKAGLIQLDTLKPCREILVNFENHTSASYGYILQQIKDFRILDEETGEFQMAVHIPDEPPERDYFENWVSQSFHLSCKKLYEEIFFKNLVASRCRASYLCESRFVFDLLNQFFPTKNNITTNTANVLLNIELPFLQDVDISALMNIRMNYGEEFQNFRLHLDKQFKDLRLIKDPEELKLKAENALHEIAEVQTHAIKQKISQFRKTQLLDAVVLLGSLFTSIHTGEWGIAAAVAAARGYKPFIDASSQVRQNPAFFLWEVLRSSK